MYILLQISNHFKLQVTLIARITKREKKEIAP